MAVDTITVQTALRTGAEVNLQSVTTLDGFRFKNDGRTVLLFTEVNAANCEITVTPVNTVDGLAVAARTVDVTASEQWVLGPWPPEIYNDSDGYLNLTVEADEATSCVPISVR